MEERNDVAETFFEAATCVDSTCVLAWTMLGEYSLPISLSLSIGLWAASGENQFCTN